jgi:hypothetical protein
LGVRHVASPFDDLFNSTAVVRCPPFRVSAT